RAAAAGAAWVPRARGARRRADVSLRRGPSGREGVPGRAPGGRVRGRGRGRRPLVEGRDVCEPSGGGGQAAMGGAGTPARHGGGRIASRRLVATMMSRFSRAT